MHVGGTVIWEQASLSCADTWLISATEMAGKQAPTVLGEVGLIWGPLNSLSKAHGIETRGADGQICLQAIDNCLGCSFWGAFSTS